MKLTDQQNRDAWKNELSKNVMLYPNDKVVAFLGRNFRNFDDNRNKKALDIGFGSGRHLKLLLDYGFQTYGIDYSEASKEVAVNLLGDSKQLKQLEVTSIEKIQYSESYFDVIVSYGVAFLREEIDIENDLRIMNRLLAPTGKMIINFRTVEDSLFRCGKKISDKTYIIDDTFPSYSGMLYTFFDIDEISELLKSTGFNILNIEREDYWKENLTQKNSWWILTVEKEKL